jgi:hypothetical protein
MMVTRWLQQVLYADDNLPRKKKNLYISTVPEVLPANAFVSLAYNMLVRRAGF